jgi:acyl-CoA reductase-like NAD-dependent aldehyde dehydrogenase
MTTEQQAPDAATSDLPTTARMMIGGESVDAADGRTFEVVNPATGRVVATAPLGGREDVDRAVTAARAAFDDRKGWASWAAGKRGRTLAKLADLIKRNSEELAWLESRNVGKPIGRARGEVIGASLVFDYYAGAANIFSVPWNMRCGRQQILDDSRVPPTQQTVQVSEVSVKLVIAGRPDQNLIR